jgi:hypothetical protein
LRSTSSGTISWTPRLAALQHAKPAPTPSLDVATWRLRVEVAGRPVAQLSRDTLPAMATDEMHAVRTAAAELFLR